MARKLRAIVVRGRVALAASLLRLVCGVWQKIANIWYNPSAYLTTFCQILPAQHPNE